MATKTFTKSITCIQPAWTMNAVATDGIYIDDYFFKNAIPILGAKLRIRAKPGKHIRSRELQIAAAIYRSMQVEAYPVFMEHWYPLTDDERESMVDLTGRFYGIGLNLVYITMGVDIPTDAEVLYAVDYALEVSY